MAVRCSVFVCLLGVIGCTKPADSRPASGPALPTAAKSVSLSPSSGGGVESAPKPAVAVNNSAEERVIRYLEMVGGRYGRSDFVPGNPITHIYLANSRMTDAGVKEIVLPTLRLIDFGQTPLTDDGLRQLNSLPKLIHLEISSPQVTDAGLGALAGLKALEFLDLRGCTQVTDAGLTHLAGLTELTTVVVKDTKVTDAGVELLRKALPKCFIQK